MVSPHKLQQSWHLINQQLRAAAAATMLPLHINPRWSQGEYQLLDIIGKGAFGCAYRARHLPTGRLVCIKTLDTPQAGQGQDEQLARQKREVAVLATLALHPNIIRCVHALKALSDPGAAAVDNDSVVMLAAHTVLHNYVLPYLATRRPLPCAPGTTSASPTSTPPGASALCSW